ncbi:hypothetical protein [Ruminococcus flavefaciens]|uniref:hypothetical protein n=1 Tax=Ruminococcus flavefaciens TaxID=1265 RepID=UPI0026F05254|nr:hypothetical protein [Ruminococcus flavefaciens]MDD7515457.1 hypothetical protein [Ruminococcus flavefaciens]MDY5690181.1 hypothetical protein [Ruminococcus flavefaciens]
MAGNDLSGIIIPINVLGYIIKNGSKYVTELNPNYKSSIAQKLGKDATPIPFNKNLELAEGVHIHFVLPSAFKSGFEKTDSNGNKTIEYHLVPDKYIITRMYVDKKTGKIINDCNIVESSFISKSSSFRGNVTIPFTEEGGIRSYRYLGRKYSGFEQPPEIGENEGFISNLCGVGPGDPLFNAYYPNCRSVFGFYDNLENVPKDAVLTYSVIGYYSDPSHDLFSAVKTSENMKKLLNQLSLKAEDDTVFNSCLLFGEICGIDLSKDAPLPVNEINTGIGRTSAEALSAVIAGKNSVKDVERKLTMIQYDMTDEVSQIDGNFKIDDAIHAYGFRSHDPIETGYNINFPKDTEFNVTNEMLNLYTELNSENQRYGKLRRTLEYQKNMLYYLWEMYMTNNTDILREKIERCITTIGNTREDILKCKNSINNKLTSLNDTFKSKDVKIEEVASKPFYSPKDPALMFFGKGLKRKYAFGEDGHFESDNTLFCNTSPISVDAPSRFTELLSAKSFNSEINQEEYIKFIVMTIILDNINILPALGETLKIERYYSPVMLNIEPYDEVTLFMEWETNFFNDYTDSSASSSSFEYGNTDYTYNGEKKAISRLAAGSSVLTPHGINNFNNKLEKYIKDHPDEKDIDILKNLMEEIRDKPAISQNLGGFTTNLAALRFAFQFPMEYADDEMTRRVQECLYQKNNEYYEPDPERLAVLSNSDVIPLREGFMDLKKLSIVSSFGNEREVIKEERLIYGTSFCSENLHPIVDGCCFLPMMLTTPARLSSHFISAADENIPSCPLPGTTPVIAIIMPDMLNMNLNIYTNTGEMIGIIKRAYRNINDQKIVCGRFFRILDPNIKIDNRISDFIDLLIKEDSYFFEIINIIDKKFNNTIPMYSSDFIFGRLLVLTEMNIKIEYYGGTEFSKNENSIAEIDDKGLMKQEFPVMIGDIERVTDGVICGFYDGFKNGFAPFGYKNALHLTAPHPTVSEEKSQKITLLMDPSLNVTLSTGFLPVEQVQINASHTDFSTMELMSSELNTLINEDDIFQAPDFLQNEQYLRQYPVLKNDVKEYVSLDIVNAMPAIGNIGATTITDGFIVKQSRKQDN